MIDRLRVSARELKRETTALYFACRDPRTPFAARLIVVCVVAYALSPLDLIPDFIPVLGLLDDLVLLPLGIALAVRLIPLDVMARARDRARDGPVGGTREGRAAAVVVVASWLAALVVIGFGLGRTMASLFS